MQLSLRKAALHGGRATGQVRGGPSIVRNSSFWGYALLAPRVRPTYDLQVAASRRRMLQFKDVQHTAGRSDTCNGRLFPQSGVACRPGHVGEYHHHPVLPVLEGRALSAAREDMSGRHVVVALLVAGLGVPLLRRLFSSPVTIVLLLPFFLLFLILGFLAANVALGYILDLTRPALRNPLPTAARPLAFSTPAAWQAVLTRSQWSHKAPQSLPPLYPESPVVSAAINDILILIVRDFVLVWYKEISSSPSFPTAVSSTLHASMERLLAKALTLDIPALVVKRVLPKVTAHIEQFRQSEVALRGAGLERKLTQSEELDLLLASRYAARGGGKLHPAVENLSSTFTKQSEENHLRDLVEKALPSILPEKEGQSRAVKIVVREIVACAVLYPIMEMLSDPDFWNRQIDQVVSGRDV